MAELGNSFLGLHNPEVEKVEVDVKMIDYEYVKNCESVNTLRAILKVLQSGREGKYPHLEETVTNKLIEMLPSKERKKIQAFFAEPSLAELKKEKLDLNEWLLRIQEMELQEEQDSDDIFESKSENNIGADRKKFLPAPRNTQTVHHSDIQKTRRNNPDSKRKEFKSKRLCKEKMSNRDYFRAWDSLNFEELEKEVDDQKNLCKEQNFIQDWRDALKDEKKSPQKDLVDSSSNEKYKNLCLSAVEKKHIANIERCKGNEYFQNNEFEKAVKCYSKCLDLDCSNITLYTNRALASIRLNNLQQAMSDCTRALKIDPDCVKARVRRGIVYHKRGQYKKAIEDFQISLDKEPDNKYCGDLLKKAKKKLNEVEGIVLQKKSKMKKIIIEQTSREDDDELLSELTDLNNQEDKQIEEIFTPGALEIVNRRNDVEGNNKRSDKIDTSLEENIIKNEMKYYKVNIIEVHDEDNRNLQVGKKKNIAHERSKEKSERFKKDGNMAMKKKQYNEALDAYTKAIQNDPENIAAFCNRSLAFLKLGKSVEAEADANKCLVRESKQIKAIFRRGLAKKMQYRLEEAYDDFLKAQEIEPKNSMVIEEIQACLSEMKERECKHARNSMNNRYTLTEVPTGVQNLPMLTQNESPQKKISNSKEETHRLFRIQNCNENIIVKAKSSEDTPKSSDIISMNFEAFESSKECMRKNSNAPYLPKTVTEMESSIMGMKRDGNFGKIFSMLDQLTRKDFKKVRKS